MPKKQSARRESRLPNKSPFLSLLGLSVFSMLLAAAVGVSYVYVDLTLNRLGVSATAIGLNAAMPALGWLIATPFLPVLLRRMSARVLLLALLAVAVGSAVAFPLFLSAEAWLPLRLLFGGSLGLAFRLVEYWINAASPDDRRGRNIGIYAALFCAGMGLGAGVLPVIGPAGWPPVLLILVLIGGAAGVLAFVRSAPPQLDALPHRLLSMLVGPAFIALAAALVYGLFEAVPYTLMPVYALRSGLTEDWAAWTVSAFLLGALVFPVPVGMLADRMSKHLLLALGGGASLGITAILPAAVTTPDALLLAMFLWGGLAGSLYTVSLAVLGDHFKGAALAAANAAFGTLYALGALVGGPLHGAAMDWHDPQGLMWSTAGLFAVFIALIGLQAMLRSAERVWHTSI